MVPQVMIYLGQAPHLQPQVLRRKCGYIALTVRHHFIRRLTLGLLIQRIIYLVDPSARNIKQVND